MRRLMFWSLMCGVLFVTATSRSDVASPSLDPAAAVGTPIDEPITGAPITPAPGTATTTPPKDPFAPYDVGPASAIWSYQDLAPAERAVVDRGLDTTGWDETNAAFSTASGEQAKRAAAAAAANQLGVAGLAATGVVP